MGIYDEYDSFSSYNGDDAVNALGGIFLALILIGAAIVVLYIVAFWKIFTKAGEQGWKCIIPFYNFYTLYKIVWDVKYFWILFAIIIASCVVSLIPVFGWIIDGLTGVVILCLTIMMNYYLARTFGHGIGYTLGLVFLGPIFILIIAFSSTYVGNGYQIYQKEKGIIANPNTNIV